VKIYSTGGELPSADHPVNNSNQQAMRVISLLPSATEVLVASSGSPDDDPVLVGRSHECDHPPYVTRHPILTSAKNKFESCAQMNEAVGTSLASGDSLYDVDAKLLQVSM